MSGYERLERLESVSQGCVKLEPSDGIYSVVVRGGGSDVAVLVGELLTQGHVDTRYEIETVGPDELLVRVIELDRRRAYTASRGMRWALLARQAQEVRE